MPDTPLSIAFDFAKSGLGGTRARLDSIRTRAATLLSAAAIVTSFLGAEALKDTKPGPGTTVIADRSLQIAEWLAIGSFIGVGIACLYILSPRWRAWPFGVDADMIVASYANKNASLGATQRALVKFLEHNRRTVEAKLENLHWVFMFGVVLLGVEVLCWVFDLTWGNA